MQELESLKTQFEVKKGENERLLAQIAESHDLKSPEKVEVIKYKDNPDCSSCKKLREEKA